MGKKKNIFIAAALTFLLILVIIGGALLLRDDTSALLSTKTSSPSKSMFEFTGTEGWRKGPTNATSMALFSSANSDGTSSCFTSIEYKTGVINVTAALQKQQDDLAASGGSMTPVATLTATIQSNKGRKQYEMHQFHLTSGSIHLMSGLELGYLQLANGYLEIQGHCNAADQLPITIAAVQAYKFIEIN